MPGGCPRLAGAAARGSWQAQIEKEIAMLGMKKARFHVRLETQPPGRARSRERPGRGVWTSRVPDQPQSRRGTASPCGKSPREASSPGSCWPSRPSARKRRGLKTLIFDEIDSGIGGKTAEFIAQKLRDLARRSSGHLHHPSSPDRLVRRRTTSGSKSASRRDRTFTTVQKLEFEERVEEISRLLSGSRITPTAVQNAREMLLHNLRE